MTIRPAIPRDLEAVKALLTEVNRVHWEGRPDLFRLCRKYTDEEILAIFADPLTPVLIAADDQDEALGYAFCVLQDHTKDHHMMPIKTLYIDDLCVFERTRGQGVGRALYDAALDLARSLGCHNLTLNVWALNDGALAFYEKCGMHVQKYGMETILNP